MSFVVRVCEMEHNCETDEQFIAMWEAAPEQQVTAEASSISFRESEESPLAVIYVHGAYVGCILKADIDMLYDWLVGHSVGEDRYGPDMSDRD